MWVKVGILLVVYGLCVTAALRPRHQKLSPYRRATPGYRLPQNVEIDMQEVVIQPFINNFTFQGMDVIFGKTTQETDKIVLHSKNLEIVTHQFHLDNIDISTQVEISFDLEKDFLIINLNQLAPVGSEFTMSFGYTGVLNDRNEGFYRASYIDEAGEERWFAMTQFESTFAREAFPCFDEPSFKTYFVFTIMREPQYNSVANAILGVSINGSTGYVLDNYMATMKQSPYILAFVVSDFANVSNGMHGVYAKPQSIADGRGDYALGVSEKILTAMEEYTDVKYQMDKLYQVAVPDKHFTFGAMENWGLVIYREKYLLYKENVSTTQEKQDIATIIAHEYTHQWFGNLVSPLWWSYIWLSEGFATFFEYYLTDVMEPEWRILDQYLVDVVQPVLEVDSWESTRPMTFDAGTPAEIDSLFDDIAYEKSGSVIRMMEHFLTPQVFRSGLQSYLSGQMFDLASEDTLYAYLQNATDAAGVQLDFLVSEIMMTWTSQSGHPVVTVTRNENGSVTLSQERFLVDNPLPAEQIWYVPINYAKLTNPDFQDTTPSLWLSTKTDVVEVGLADSEWIILNKQQTGFYRVNYDIASWTIISNYLRTENYSVIHLYNRAQLIDDAFNLAKAGRLPYSIVLELMGYLEPTGEADFIVLSTLLRNLAYLNDMLVDDPGYQLFKIYIMRQLQAAYQTLGTDLSTTDSHTDVLNRINVLNWMCKLGSADCQTKMNAHLRTWQYVEPDLQGPVYCGGIRGGGPEEFQYLLETLYESPAIEPYHKNRVATGIGCYSTDFNIILDRSVSTKNSALFQGVSSGSPEGLEAAFSYFTTQFSSLQANFSKDQIASIMNGLSSRLRTPSHLSQFQAFVDGLDSATQDVYFYNLSLARQNIEANLLWIAKYGEEISSWLTQNVGGT